MKKTIITLLALASVAGAVTEYTATFADSKTSELTSERSHIIFGDTTATTPLTLTSWMVEFSLTKFSDAGTLLAVTPSDPAAGSGVGLRTNGADGVGIMFSNSNSYYGNSKTDKIFVDSSKVSATTPLTLRYAYDAKSNMLYLYDVTNEKIISHELEAELILSSVAANHDGSDVKNVTQFMTMSKKFNFTLSSVTDMSSLAGNDAAFVTYVKTKTTVSIPEPATATLSLLALAGLCARRRRK